ncbi:MAG: hypothetical protein AAGC57_01085 [Pseudomonadota bacterium]
MDLTRQIDVYCERVSAAFWAEPFNALTNLAFIVAGVLALMAEARRNGIGTARTFLAGALMASGIIAIFTHVIALLFAVGSLFFPTALVVPMFVLGGVSLVAGLLSLPRGWWWEAPDWAVTWLAGNAVVVGIGSFLFHTFATPWAGAADTGPILLFILGYFVVSMHRYGGLGWRGAALATAGFLVGMVLLSAGLRATIGPLVGGSQSYFPALLALLGVGFWLARARRHAAGPVLMRAAGIFAVSLTFRTIDGPLCEWIPIGTHFLWHLFNALLLWVLLDCLVRHGRIGSTAPGSATPQPA